MNSDELAQYLDALQREDCYRVDSTLKESPHEVTQRVYFVGSNGSESGPFIRKTIARDVGLGEAYKRIYAAQKAGQRFLHIPRIIECYVRDDALVVVMEYVQGETLQDYIYNNDPSLELAQRVFPQLCDAVSELHDGFTPSIIHRDLKPSNIILSNGNLTIIDFGISREFKDNASADTHQFGTRAFAPPEQFGFGQTTVRSDVYALGMILYYCLTEEIPTPDVRERIKQDERLPEPIRGVLLRSTEFDPAARFASAAEQKAMFLKALRWIEQNETAPAPSPATVPASSPAPTPATLPTPTPAPATTTLQTPPTITQTAPAPTAPAYVAPNTTTVSHPTPQPFAAPTAPQPPAEPQKPLSRAGLVWNIVLAGLTVVYIVAAALSYSNPPSYLSALAPIPLALYVFVFAPLWMLCIAWALCYKEPLKRRFPHLQFWQWYHSAILVVACFIVSMALDILIK